MKKPLGKTKAYFDGPILQKRRFKRLENRSFDCIARETNSVVRHIEDQYVKKLEEGSLLNSICPSVRGKSNPGSYLLPTADYSHLFCLLRITTRLDNCSHI